MPVLKLISRSEAAERNEIMSVRSSNLFNYSRPLPKPFDSLKIKSQSGFKVLKGTEATLCGAVIKAVHAYCNCLNGTGEGAVGWIDGQKCVAEYKSSMGPDAYHLVVFDTGTGTPLASVYDKKHGDDGIIFGTYI